jgi:hypothetical protein
MSVGASALETETTSEGTVGVSSFLGIDDAAETLFGRGVAGRRGRRGRGVAGAGVASPAPAGVASTTGAADSAPAAAAFAGDRRLLVRGARRGRALTGASPAPAAG